MGLYTQRNLTQYWSRTRWPSPKRSGQRLGGAGAHGRQNNCRFICLWV